MTKQITVMWKGPFISKEVIDGYHLNNADSFDVGLYQIYGPHELYSNKRDPANKKVLLYIGKTGDSFSNRILAEGFCLDSEHEIYLGRVEGYDDNRNSWKSDVGDAEKLLINKYGTPFNSQYCGDLGIHQFDNKDCEIINLGKKVDLDDKVTMALVYNGTTQIENIKAS